MCGILVIATTGDRPTVDLATAQRLRDRLAHRGPDDAGLWADGPAIVAHRRLAILDPAGGAQPWIERDERGQPELVLAYNGELYDHLEMRRWIDGPFRTRSDTETLARLLATRGPETLERVRGMFALAAWWPRERRLLLARDPLGIKPLCYATVARGGAHEIVAASEPGAILDHPHVPVEPDWTTVSAYLSTIRTTLDDRTMYAGVHTLRPGERLVFDLSRRTDVLRPRVDVDARVERCWPRVDAAPADGAARTREIREEIASSVDAHLLADAPIGAMLSGGLDSALTCTLTARAKRGTLQTWCAGAVDPESAASDDAAPDGGDVPEPGPGADDLAYAAFLADRLGTAHEQVEIDRAFFLDAWRRMVRDLGRPLGTPNEVAIRAVAAAARPHVSVLLSGEGADECFLGYEQPLHAILAHAAAAPRPGHASPTELLLGLTSWIPLAAKPSVLQPAIYGDAGADRALVASVDRDTATTGTAPDPRPLLSALGRRNLAGLLDRLDAATMLESIEGRTPLADVAVALAAAELPVSVMLAADSPAASLAAATSGASPASPTNAVATAVATAAPASARSLARRRLASTAMHRTAGSPSSTAVVVAPPKPTPKAILRRAFAPDLPASIVARPKASFPLPFAQWVGGAADVLDGRMVREVFTREAIEAVRSDPRGHALAAWPIFNVALWLERWA